MSTATPRALNFSFSVPNFVTSIRVVLTFVIAWLLFQGGDGNTLAAGIILVVAALTDWADGFLARRMKRTSLFGSLYDMVADQLLFIPVLILSISAGLFARVDGLMPLNPYPYAIPALAGGVAALTGIVVFLIKRRKMDIEFPTPTMVAKCNYWFWLVPLILAVFKLGPDWLLAAFMYLAIISTLATFYSYLKKGSYVFTD